MMKSRPHLLLLLFVATQARAFVVVVPTMERSGSVTTTLMAASNSNKERFQRNLLEARLQGGKKKTAPSSFSNSNNQERFQRARLARQLHYAASQEKQTATDKAAKQKETRTAAAQPMARKKKQSQMVAKKKGKQAERTTAEEKEAAAEKRKIAAAKAAAAERLAKEEEERKIAAERAAKEKAAAEKAAAEKLAKEEEERKIAAEKAAAEKAAKEKASAEQKIAAEKAASEKKERMIAQQKAAAEQKVANDIAAKASEEAQQKRAEEERNAAAQDEMEELLSRTSDLKDRAKSLGDRVLKGFSVTNLLPSSESLSETSSAIQKFDPKEAALTLKSRDESNTELVAVFASGAANTVIDGVGAGVELASAIRSDEELGSVVGDALGTAGSAAQALVASDPFEDDIQKSLQRKAKIAFVALDLIGVAAYATLCGLVGYSQAGTPVAESATRAFDEFLVASSAAAALGLRSFDVVSNQYQVAVEEGVKIAEEAADTRVPEKTPTPAPEPVIDGTKAEDGRNSPDQEVEKKYYRN